MQRGSTDVLSSPLPLNQAQELLARAFGHADWHHLGLALKKPLVEDEPAQAEHPFQKSAERFHFYQDLLDNVGSKPFSDSEMRGHVKSLADVYSRYGKTDIAQVLTEELVASMDNGRTFGEAVAQIIVKFAPREAMAFEIVSHPLNALKRAGMASTSDDLNRARARNLR